MRNRKPGDRVVVHCNHVDDQDPAAHDDSMLAGNQRIWGYETNFGGLAELAVVKANQLLPKPAHLTWSSVNALCNSTSYRMLVSRNGAAMKQGDVVFIWGATGGLGGHATQLVLHGGGLPVGVVEPGQGGAAARARMQRGSRPHREAVPLLAGRAHPGRGRVAPPGPGRPGLVGEAGAQVHQNRHEGKIGVRCLAPRDGLGVTDPAFRDQVGEDRITLFRRYTGSHACVT